MWVGGAMVLGIIEVLVPTLVVLGFAVGAVITGLLIWVGVLAGVSLPWVLLYFAIFSMVAYIAARFIFGKRTGQVKIWEDDINDN